MRNASNYALRLPASLKKEGAKLAVDDGTTINQFIVSAVAEKLSAMKTAGYFLARAKRANLDVFDRIMARKGDQAHLKGDELPADRLLS
jgi:hypothetical protein